MTRASNIRRLFLESKSSYPLQDAASILGMSVRELREWTEAGEIEGAETDHGQVLPWAELVTFAMGFWDQEEVEEALGSELASVIPELVRLTDLEVRIPKMEVVALERVAARERKSVDAVLARELLDFVSAHSEWLGADLRAAMQWPGGTVQGV